MSKLLPCPECGAEAFHGEDTTTVVEMGGYEFQGQPSVREVPAKICPKCGEEIGL